MTQKNETPRATGGNNDPKRKPSIPSTGPLFNRDNEKNIPKELQRLKRWILWKYERAWNEKNKEWRLTKVPYSAKTKCKASSTRGSSWSNLSLVLYVLKQYGKYGLGFVFAGDGIIGVDLDHCRNPETGEIEEWALEIIRELNSYTEISPSGTGIHIILRGTPPEGGRNRKGKVEIYWKARYFTVTGEHLPGTPLTVEERTEALAAVHALHVADPDPVPPPPPRSSPRSPVNLSDAEIIEKAKKNEKNGDKFTRLWNGNFDRTHSEADLALCSYLAFWTGGDAQAIDRLFRQSGLYRDKWNRQDYRERTIKTAIDGTPEGYSNRGEKSRLHTGDGDKIPKTLKKNENLSPSPPEIYRYQRPPTEVLPEPIRAFTEEAAAALQCEPALLVLPTLVQIAGAIGNAAELHPTDEWRIPPVLWGVIIAESGGMKTPALRLALQFVRSHDKSLWDKNRETLELYETNLAEWDSADRKTRGSKPSRPVEKRLIIEDVTLEALADRLAANPWGLMLDREELNGWARSFDAYKRNKGGEVSTWLKLHDALSIVIDRKSGENPSLRVERPHLSIIGGIQPTVARDMLTGENSENGLAARLLVVMPHPRPRRWNRRGKMNEGTVQAMGGLIENLLKWKPDEPLHVIFSPEAEEVWAAFYDEHNMEMESYHGAIRSAWAKMEGYALRLALVLHCAEWAANPWAGGVPGECLKASTMQSAISLARWFRHEALRVYRSFSETQEETELRELMEWIDSQGGEVTERDVKRGKRRYRENPDLAEAHLQLLVKTGRGEWIEDSADEKPGPRFRVFRLTDSAPPGDKFPENLNENENLSPSPLSPSEKTPSPDPKQPPWNPTPAELYPEDDPSQLEVDAI